jgi:phospholipid transport system substrate-binding protein
MKKLCLAICLSLFSWLAVAQESPDALVKRVTEEVLEIVRSDKDIQNGHTQKIINLVDAKVFPHFDFSRMTALAVGREWRKATPQQKEQLAHEFKTLLVRTYANAVSGYRNQRVIFKPFKPVPAGQEALVRTEVQQPGSKPIELDYSLELKDSGWKVFDVTIAGISLVTNYRDQFGQEIRNGGLDGLIATLAAKNKALEASSLAKAEKK